MDSDNYQPGSDEYKFETYELQFEMPYYEQVLADIQAVKSTSWQKNLITLAVTLLIFVQIGLFRNGLASILSIIVVLFVHESGHFLAMKLFGYENIQMFFIPMFGAAVSGESRNAAAYKKALVTILGPLPGIFIGTVLMVVHTASGSKTAETFGLMFLIINVFNLLPFFPLDGGRFLNEVLFSRNRHIELVFRIIAGLAIIAISVALQAWFLLIFGILGLITIRHSFRMAGIAGRLKKEYDPDAQLEDVIVPIVDTVHLKTPKGGLNHQTMVSCAKDVWERFQSRPPRLAATFGLLVLYVFAWLMPLIGMVAAGFASAANTEHTIVTSKMPDGSTVFKLHIHSGGELICDMTVDNETWLFSGPGIDYYYGGAVKRESFWVDGLPDGEMKFYGLGGNLKHLVVLDHGKFVSFKTTEDDRLVEKTRQDVPFMLDAKLTEYAEGTPKGPDVETIADFYRTKLNGLSDPNNTETENLGEEI